MISQFESYLTFENIYLWTNFGVIPFWLMLIFIPNYRTTQVLTNSVILPLILASAYSYTIYQVVLLDGNIFEILQFKNSQPKIDEVQEKAEAEMGILYGQFLSYLTAEDEKSQEAQKDVIFESF